MKTFKDVYDFPFKLDSYIGWVYDANENFAFEFEIASKEARKKFLNVINSTTREVSQHAGHFYHKDGYIYNGNLQDSNDNDIAIILIRGWGNLTGTGGMNLPAEEAANIQNTLAEYIVRQLNKK